MLFRSGGSGAGTNSIGTAAAGGAGGQGIIIIAYVPIVITSSTLKHRLYNTGNLLTNTTFNEIGISNPSLLATQINGILDEVTRPGPAMSVRKDNTILVNGQFDEITGIS